MRARIPRAKPIPLKILASYARRSLRTLSIPWIRTPCSAEFSPPRRWKEGKDAFHPERNVATLRGSSTSCHSSTAWRQKHPRHQDLITHRRCGTRAARISCPRHGDAFHDRQDSRNSLAFLLRGCSRNKKKLRSRSGRTVKVIFRVVDGPRE